MRASRATCSELMRQACAGGRGEREAFGKLAAVLQDDLFRFALAQGLRRPDAAEAVQEAFLRAYRRRGNWQADGDAVAWIYGIAMNVVRELRRKCGRERLGLAVDEPDLAGGDAGRSLDAETLLRVARAIEMLPSRQREAVGCRFLKQMSVRDTAAAMGCAEGTVKATVWAAIGNLRKAMRRLA